MNENASNGGSRSTVLAQVDRQLTGDPIWWCLRPFLETVHYWPPSTWRVKAAAVARVVSLQPEVYRAGGVAAVVSTRNQRRTLSPVVRALGGPSIPDRPGTGTRHFGPSGLGGRPSNRDAEQAGLEVLSDLGLAEMRPVWMVFCASVRVAIRRASRALDALRSVPGRSMLVASQHDPLIRSWLVAARARGVPSFYIPHAPVARAAHYADLPFTAVGLRGTEERRFYSRMGADAKQIFIVGNPASDLLGRQSCAVSTAPGVLALSAWPSSRLADVLTIVKEAGIGDVIVAPHPRSNVSALARQMPPSWKLWTGHTAELLKEGVAFLVQHSSGVAWESAALGIPTAQIVLDQAPPSYPLLDDDVFVKCSSSESLHHFADRARAGAWRDEEVRAGARRWCEMDGVAALDAAHKFVLENATRSDGPMVLDGWGPARAATSRSRIAGEVANPS